MDVKFCPVCASRLNPREMLDIFTKGYICDNGHKSHKILKDVGQNLAKYANIDKTCGKNNPLEIIQTWLSEKKMRKFLHDQFGEFLMAHLDLLNGNELNDSMIDYTWCPTCDEKLERMPTDDLYVMTLKCNYGHTWYNRGGMWQEKRLPIFKLDIDYKYYCTCYDFYVLNTEYEDHFSKELKDAVISLKLNDK